MSKSTKKSVPEQVKKVTADSFYNIDTGKGLGATARAIAGGQARGLTYDREYGLVGTSREAIDSFIQEHSLSKLAQPLGVDAPAAGSAKSTASSKAAASSDGSALEIGGAKSKSPGSASVADIRRIREALEKRVEGKFINISSMRQVKGGSSAYVYNAALGIAAAKSDLDKLNQVTRLLGGSPSGSAMPADELGDELSTPSSARVVGSAQFGKMVYGLPSAVASASELVQADPSIALKLDELPEDDSAIIVPVAPKRVMVNSRPAVPSLRSRGILAPKAPIVASFDLGKPTA